MNRRLFSLCLGVLASVSCGDDGGLTLDASSQPDGSTPDVRLVDDVGLPDVSSPDGGGIDAHDPTDASSPDVGMIGDAGMPDVSTPDPRSTCSDGIQNGHERGVDCGGACGACPGCEDGVQNGTETGVDCGRSCGACLCQAQTQIPAAECNVLVDLFDFNNGANWRSGFGWRRTETPCSWPGVMCADDHVVDLHLGGVDGPFPNHITRLTELRSLFLAGGELIGPIPPEIGDFEHLVSLTIGNTGLRGPIPPEIGNLATLQSLNLGTNQLTGGIPPELGNLSELTSFSVEQNRLTGGIPADLRRLASIQTLILRDNQLTGSIPSELGSLMSLHRIDFANNQLSGAIPPNLRSRSIRLDNNQLTGPIPADIAAIPGLTSLSLRGNRLTGAIPAMSTTLRSLDLRGNRLTGAFPASLTSGLQHRLALVDVGDNQLTSLPDTISMPAIEVLSIDHNLISGELPPSLHRHRGLTLGIRGNGCVTAADPDFATWLARLDPEWNASCGSSCDDGALNGTETDIDCGGLCGPCTGSAACEYNGDCVTGTCGAESSSCQP